MIEHVIWKKSWDRGAGQRAFAMPETNRNLQTADAPLPGTRQHRRRAATSVITLNNRAMARDPLQQFRGGKQIVSWARIASSLVSVLGALISVASRPT